MRKPNPMRSAVQTFRAMNPRHHFAARLGTARVGSPSPVAAKKDEEVVCGEMFLYDAIGSDWMGGIGSKDVAAAVKDIEAGGAKRLNIYINSPGGDVFEGTAIYNVLSRFKGHKTVYVDGLAASAASYIAMVGDEIITAFNAMWMIHNPWGVVIGNANDMRATAETLDTVGGTLVETYVKRTGQAAKDIAAWMDAETWMDAKEAKERGFTDSITEEDDDEEEEMEAGLKDPTSATTSLLAKYAHTPDKMRPSASALVATMEQRVLNLPKRASPPKLSPGQPGKK